MKALKILGSFVALLLVLLIVALTTLWVKPEILFNEKMARKAITAFAPPTLKIEWRGFSLGFRPQTWKGKAIELKLKGLCVVLPGTVNTCLDNADLNFAFEFRGLKPTLTQISRLNLQMAHLTVPPGEETPRTQALPDLRLPDILSYVSPELDFSLLDEAEVNIQHVEIESASGPSLHAALRVTKTEATKNSGEFRVDGGAFQDKNLRADLGGELTLLHRPTSLRFHGDLEVQAKDWRLDSPLRLQLERSLTLTAKPRLSGSQNLSTQLAVAWSTSDIELVVSSPQFPQSWPHGRVKVSECAVRSALHSGLGYPAETTMNCGFALQPKSKVLPQLAGSITSELSLESKGADEIRGRLKFEEKSQDSLLESSILLEANAGYNLNQGALLEPRYSLNANLRVPEFKQWKEFWEKTSFAVPAPFHVLGGPVNASISLPAGDELNANATFTLSSDLKSAGQSVVVNSGAEIRVQNPLSEGRTVDIDSRVALTDVQLEAPPLRLESPPQFLPDSRFVNSKTASSVEAPKATPSNTRWKLQIETGQPLRISSNLLPTPLPIALNLTLSHATPLQGRVALQPMPLKIFKKQAKVEHIYVDFPPGAKVGELNGLITHRTPEVLIRVLLLGNTENIRVEFQSDPPLSEQQILAVFLYNKSLAELSEEEANSTQNLSQAMSEGALGLFSLFFLSSTPIQSVGYDPVTQNYSARVGLDDKTTLSVGSDFADVREFGLRRRLGGQWALRTELRQEENRADVVLTLIEWFKRF